MAGKYRILHTTFWNEDPDMYELTPEQKYFYIYLLTSPQTKQCGISKFSFKIARDQTGYNEDTVKKLLRIFQEDLNKIKYNPETKELAIKNWGKWNYFAGNPKVKKQIDNELKEIKDRSLINYVWEKIDEAEIPEIEDNNTKELKEDIAKVFEYWKKATNHNRAKLSPERESKIKARLKDFSVEDLIQAINGCVNSPFHMGQNNEKKVYDSIGLISRNIEKTEKFMELANRQTKKPMSIKDYAKEFDFDMSEV